MSFRDEIHNRKFIDALGLGIKSELSTKPFGFLRHYTYTEAANGPSWWDQPIASKQYDSLLEELIDFDHSINRDTSYKDMSLTYFMYVLGSKFKVPNNITHLGGQLELQNRPCEEFK